MDLSAHERSTFTAPERAGRFRTPFSASFTMGPLPPLYEKLSTPPPLWLLLLPGS
jgi:hypothetical protein